MLLPGSGRIFSGSRIRTPLEKCDSPKSPQGYCRAVADPDFQMGGGGGGGRWAISLNFFRPFGPQFGLNITGAPPLDPPLIGKGNGFQEKDDRSSGYGFVVKKERECGLRNPRLLVSFPQRLAYESNISFTHINDNKNNKFYIEIQLISSYIKHPQRGYKLI